MESWDKAYSAGRNFSEGFGLCDADHDINQFVTGLYDGCQQGVEFAHMVIEKLRNELNRRNRIINPAAYLEVAPGVRLTRYRGTNVTRLIAVRKGREGNADVVFEIRIDHRDKEAIIARDAELLFEIKTEDLCPRRLQTAAISVLRSYLRENQHIHQLAARARKRRAAAEGKEA